MLPQYFKAQPAWNVTINLTNNTAQQFLDIEA